MHIEDEKIAIIGKPFEPCQDAGERFFLLWRTYYARLLTFCRLSGSSDAEDDVQEIFLKIFRGLPAYHGRGRIESWVYQIARNHLVDRHRRVKLTTESAGDMQSVPDPHESVSRANDRSWCSREADCEPIGRFLQSLNFTDRKISYLRMYERMRYREISAVLAIPVGTIKYRVSVIRSQYRRFQEAYGES
ncbi:MAG TPA: RNA polymerase sigma factor [Spirochaetia bacterium]|nr:RNA polymerase sigma factor [Spirochaetia bacterium]